MYRILIVDDEKIERNGIRFLLKQMDISCEIMEAVNGKEALERLRTEDFDILLTDVKMPFMDGIELISNVEQLDKDIRCVIFSGCNEFEYAKKAIKLGVIDYILKPVNPSEFKSTIMKVIQEVETSRAESDLKNKSLQYLNEHILFMLLNGADVNSLLTSETGQTIARHLEQYHRMMLIEFNNEFFGKKNDEFLANPVLMNSGMVQYLNLNQQQSVLFFETAEQDYREVASQIADMSKKVFDEECYLAISGVMNEVADIPKNMDEMEVLMENKFYHPEIHVFYEGMNQDPANIIQFDDDTLMKQMKQDIKMKDISGLREHFERFCAKYRSRTEYSQIYIKFLFSNLLKDIYSNMEAAGEKELNAEIERLYMVADFGAVMEIVNTGIDRLESKFADQPQAAHKEVEVVIQYIYENYGQELCADKLAEMVYMAPSYLSAVFKKETGQNLSKFIKGYRMGKAKDMLENSLMKIVDIGEACGYPNVSYFCSSFREYYGVSPQKFRENGGGRVDEE